MDSDERLRRYLLEDSLSSDERRQVEEEYLESRAGIPPLEVAEEMLIEQYLRDELPASARRSFVRRFLSSRAQRRSVALTRAILEHFAGDEEIVPQVSIPSGRSASRFLSWSPRPAAAAILTIALAALVWLTVVTTRLRSELDAARSRETQLQQRVEQLEQRRPEDQSARLKPPVVVPFALSTVIRSRTVQPGTSSADTLHQVVPPGTDILRLSIVVPAGNSYKSYGVRVFRPGDRRSDDLVWSTDDLVPQTTTTGRALVIDVPARLMRPDGYILTVDGARNDGTWENLVSYQFAVTQ